MSGYLPLNIIFQLGVYEYVLYIDLSSARYEYGTRMSLAWKVTSVGSNYSDSTI